MYSIEDDSALRAKVDEALTVYDEYVKNNKGDGEAESGDAKEEKAEEKPTVGVDNGKERVEEERRRVGGACKKKRDYPSDAIVEGGDASDAIGYHRQGWDIGHVRSPWERREEASVRRRATPLGTVVVEVRDRGGALRA